ncbi:MAG: M20/M25/M40 family metallo-hydrolase, partial [Spirochaetaceae bacterium]|nr:M20/M25/M40 family metallo-hydrolase [Spirochaetaceae bacterium]
MDPVAITQDLVRMDTVNPPGNEERAVEYLARLLEGAGFELQRVPFQPGRSGLVAVLNRCDGPYLCFSGHLDTVPVGDAEWTTDPFSGEIRGDRLYGRGASDMKSGVAVMTSAAISCAADKEFRSNLLLVYSPAEETGCEGARVIAEQVPLLSEVGAIVVAEPTDNAVYVGHKGALWLELGFRGVTAHGAMPHLGRNAVHAAAAVGGRLAELGPELGPSGPLGP